MRTSESRRTQVMTCAIFKRGELRAGLRDGRGPRGALRRGECEDVYMGVSGGYYGLLGDRKGDGW